MSRQRALRSLIVPAIFMVMAVFIFAALGRWQLMRREWKHHLIETIETRSKLEPASLDHTLGVLSKAGVEQLEFSRVRVKGQFEHAHERHLYALLDGAPGWRVITPLRMEDGSHVLVDRGFVPVTLKEPQTRLQGQIGGEVELTGAVRAPGFKDWMGPDNDRARNQWHWRDLNGMAAGVAPPVVPFFLEAEPAPAPVPGGWPKSTPVHAQLSDRHLEYALTWFGLAGTAVIMFGVFAWSRAALPGNASEPNK